MPTLTTACPRNCYSTCALRVEVEDGRIRRILPEPGNRATAGGPCLKGLSYVERQVADGRILHPLRRRPGGDFERVSWDAALDEIAERLDGLRRDPGPQSVLYYASSGTKGLLNSVGETFWRRFGGFTTTYGDLCWPAGLEASRLTLGANRHNAPWDLENARLIILWGKNSAETNIHQMVFVEKARQRGAKVVVIDPRRTQTAERAELWIQPRPGTDGALALALAHRLIADDHVDREFVDAHVHGFEPFRERALEMTPTRAAEICDVPLERIEELAADLATRRPATVCAGFGMQRYTNSGQTMRAMIALLALTGNLGKPGAGWQFANLQTSEVWGGTIDPLDFYPPETLDGIARVEISTARLGRDLRRLIDDGDPPLRMAWVERGNPLTQNPESHAVAGAFADLESRVVVEQFLTDTARAADLVLPAKTMFEQTDVIGAYWHPYLQLRERALEPAGEVKPESEIYRLLAERLGLLDGLAAAAVPALFPVGDGEVRAWLETRLGGIGLSLDSFADGPVLVPGHQEIAFADRVFPTPSGKIELASEEAVRRWQVDATASWSEHAESPRGAGEEAERFPLYLMTPNTKNRIHSQFGNLAMIRRVDDGPTAQIHPDDAAARGLAPGDRLRIWNDRGEIVAAAKLDWGIRRGCVAVTNGWWAADGANVNVCSMGRETDLGHGAAFHDCLVEMAPV